MNIVSKHARVARAVHLISVGIRPNIVTLDTGLSVPLLRNIYREVHGVRATSGPLPSPEGILRTRARYVEACTLLPLYIKLADRPNEQVDLDALVEAGDLQGQAMPKEIDINQAWVLARAFRAGSILLTTCRNCRATLIGAPTHRLRPDCPFCGPRSGPAQKARTTTLVQAHHAGLAA